jgi:2-keto-4-pentenoate hydratase
MPAAATLTQEQRQAAARLLWTHWQAGTTLDALPTELRPQNRGAGYAIQAQLPEVGARQVVGWKIAATSAAGQAHIRVSGPLAGRLLSGQIDADGATLTLAGNRMRVAEPEFAFRFGTDLAPRTAPYTVDQVLAAVDTLHPAIEIPDSRYAVFTQVGEAQLIADNACAHRFMLGAAAPAAWRGIDLRTHRVHGEVFDANGRRTSREGEGSVVLGDPRVALAWLVNELSGLGITLNAGQFVTTGTCMVPLEVLPGDKVRVDYGALGRMAVNFTA